MFKGRTPNIKIDCLLIKFFPFIHNILLIIDNKLQKVLTEYKTHNERGAGRKAKFTDLEKETIRMYRIQGKTFKTIAEMLNCSVGLIYKLINE